MNIVGQNGDAILFSQGDESIVIDSVSNTITKSGSTRTLLASAEWAPIYAVNESILDLADAALTTLDIGITASIGRLYTVPANVKTEVMKALSWISLNGKTASPAAAFSAPGALQPAGCARWPHHPACPTGRRSTSDKGRRLRPCVR